MPRPLTELLQTVQVSDPREAGGLQVFGLRWEDGPPLSYTTLDEALATQLLEVTEVNEGGSVPILKVTNKGQDTVFLMAGEQLVGARQNRVLNASILVAGQTVLPVPVSCVEAGRWGYRSRRFSSSGTSSHSHLRHKMAKQAHMGYREAGSPTSDQGEVWSEVSRKLTAMHSPSSSQALDQAYTDHHKRLLEVLDDLKVPEGCHGVTFAFGGRIAGLDLFDQPATLARLWPKLVRAYAIDALEEPAASTPVSPDAVRRWLQSSLGVKEEPFKSPGLGEDVRLEGKELVGAGLVVEGRPVHVELFPESENGAGS